MPRWRRKRLARIRRKNAARGVISTKPGDFLDEVIAERTRANPKFPAIVCHAQARVSMTGAKPLSKRPPKVPLANSSSRVTLNGVTYQVEKMPNGRWRAENPNGLKAYGVSPFKAAEKAATL